MPDQPRHILITGHPGVGKTTVIMKVADQLMGRRPAGFYTREIRQHGNRVGFEVQTFSGERAVLAHIDRHNPPHVGRYGVDLQAFEQCVLPELERDADLFLIDEIGKMECFSQPFVQRIKTLLDGQRPIVATVALKGSGLIAEVKNRPDVEILTVTPRNRDGVPPQIVGSFLSP